MNSLFEEISVREHAELHIDPQIAEQQLATAQFCALSVDEFESAAGCYPLFFIKDSRNGRLFPIALFGFEAEQNLFHAVQKPNAPSALYLPNDIRLQAFSIGTESRNGTVHLSYLINPTNVQVSGISGKPLFLNKSETPFLTHIKKATNMHLMAKQKSVHFIEALLDCALLKKVSLSAQYANGESKKVSGLYFISQDTLNELPNERIVKLHHQHYFKLIYAMANSIHNIYDILDLAKNKGAAGIRSIELANDNS